MDCLPYIHTFTTAMLKAVQEFGKIFITGALDLLFPPKCSICGTEGPELICTGCRDRIDLLPAPFCRKCGLPAGGSIPRCFDCRRYYAFDSARSAGWHQEELRKAIHLLKYQGRRALARPLAQLMAESPAGKETRAEMIIPVPLHGSRLRSRGFNQSELLAKELSQILDIPVFPRLLVRCRDTSSQVGRSAEERLASLKGAFDVRNAKLIAGRDVLVIDDVFTTGSTASEVARTLKNAGAGRVLVFTLSRER